MTTGFRRIPGDVILLDPSDAKRRFLMKKQVSRERGSKKGVRAGRRITTGLPPDYSGLPPDGEIVGPL